MAEEIDNVADAEPMEETKSPEAPTLKVPFIITLAALLLYFAFQTLQMVVERGNLGMVKANQEGSIQEAQRIQAQFKTLISKTSELAKQGHAGAKMIMDGLQSQGLSVAPETKEVMPEAKAPSKAAPAPSK
jgi:hypothetical protein